MSENEETNDNYYGFDFNTGIRDEAFYQTIQYLLTELDAVTAKLKGLRLSVIITTVVHSMALFGLMASLRFLRHLFCTTPSYEYGGHIVVASALTIFSAIGLVAVYTVIKFLQAKRDGLEIYDVLTDEIEWAVKDEELSKANIRLIRMRLRRFLSATQPLLLNFGGTSNLYVLFLAFNFCSLFAGVATVVFLIFSYC